MSPATSSETADQRKTDSGDEDHRDFGLLEERRRAVVTWFKETFIPKTYSEIGAASTAENQRLAEGLRYLEQMRVSEKKFREELGGWEKFMRGEARDMISSAHRLYHEELMDKLLRARSESPPIVSMTSIAEWSHRFKDRETPYKMKEKFVRSDLPQYIQNWRIVARKRSALLKRPEIKRLSSKDVEKFDVFMNEEAFLNLHFSERQHLVGLVAAATSAAKYTMGALYRHALTTLTREAGESLQPSKVGTWMEHIFDSAYTLEEIETFLGSKGRLEQLINNWRSVVSRYDKIEDERTREGSPPYFNFVTRDKFLSWNYHQRVSYVETAEQAMRVQKENPIILDIRREIAMKDWESARDTIEQAKRIDLGQNDRRHLASLEIYVHEHGDEAAKDSDPLHAPEEVQSALREMRMALASLPPAARSLHIKSIYSGEAACRALAAVEFNRVWCWQNGHLDTTREGKLKERAHVDTMKTLEEGHGRSYQNVRYKGYREPTIRKYQQGEWAPQVVWMSEDGTDSFKKILEDQAGNYSFKYWTTLIYEDMSYNSQKSIVEHINPLIRSGMRTLAKHGFRFSLVGPPVCVN